MVQSRAFGRSRRAGSGAVAYRLSSRHAPTPIAEQQRASTQTTGCDSQVTLAISETWCSTLLIIILAAAAKDGVAQTRSGPDTVWVAGGCATGRALRVEVLLADTVIYRTSFTICRRQRSQIPLTYWPFSFKPSTRLVWSNDSTNPTNRCQATFGRLARSRTPLSWGSPFNRTTGSWLTRCTWPRPTGLPARL